MADAIQVKVPVGPEGARMARQQLAGLKKEIDRDVLDNLGLMVQVGSGRIRVEVTDTGPGFDPQPLTPSMYQTSGWGLFLVDQLSDRWGVIRGDSTRVWFELDRRAHGRDLASASAGR